MMQNNPGTILRLVHDSDRGSVVQAPHPLWRTWNRIIYNFGATDATAAPILDWTVLGGPRVAFCWKGYNVPAADLSLGINATKHWKIYVTLASFNTFPQVGHSITWVVNGAQPVKVVDSYTGLDYDDSEIKDLRQKTVGDWQSASRSALTRNVNSEGIPNDNSVSAGFQPFGGAADHWMNL